MGRERYVAGIGVDGCVDDVWDVYTTTYDKCTSESEYEAGDVCKYRPLPGTKWRARDGRYWVTDCEGCDRSP